MLFAQCRRNHTWWSKVANQLPQLAATAQKVYLYGWSNQLIFQSQLSLAMTIWLGYDNSGSILISDLIIWFWSYPTDGHNYYDPTKG